MKKLFFIFTVLFSANTFAYITQDIVDGCDSAKQFYPVFQINSYTCDSGYYLPANSDRCENCLRGYNCAGGTYIFNQTTDQGIFTLSYTCNSGYFLPADTLGCQPCPSGHICNGGTFEYNPTKSQGITFTRPINANVTHGCSVNFGTHLVPIFQPNTVTLNYDDGVGNTASTSCTYDGLVNLPPTPPTREGYDFKGWKVVTNNE